MLAWRNNSGFVKTAAGYALRMGTAGMPDILYVHPQNGKLEGVEVKRNWNQKLNPNQIAMAKRFDELGINYHVTADAFCMYSAIDGGAEWGMCGCWKEWT